ncbi:MAG: hypothetical protein JJU29_13455 [Verrucomicrobia bacterium]|nr:hypothetical protein [Verrucomicrobiota bacterium]MCH8513212.1 hypothetical protein [Kiritimatiellia bacterium]
MEVQLFIMFVFGTICALIASAKGRSGVGWFFIGFFFPLIGLILILIMSDLKAEQQKQQHMLNEQRRLREQLRQERLRNQAFQQYTAERLDVHDQALSLDTRSADAHRLELDDRQNPGNSPKNYLGRDDEQT